MYATPRRRLVIVAQSDPATDTEQFDGVLVRQRLILRARQGDLLDYYTEHRAQRGSSDTRVPSSARLRT